VDQTTPAPAEQANRPSTEWLDEVETDIDYAQYVLRCLSKGTRPTPRDEWQPEAA